MKILLLGSRGFVGSALKEKLSDFEVFSPTREELDIRDISQTEKVIRQLDPEVIISAVGRVAGIQGNIAHPSSLMIENVEISVALAKACHVNGVRKLVQFGSACMYPTSLNRAAIISDIGTGQIEPTSQFYGQAKLFGFSLFESFNKEFNYEWVTAIPSNLYGPQDWKHGPDSHAIAMLVKKFIDSKRIGRNEVEIWGDGTAQRHFLHVEDFVASIKVFMEKGDFATTAFNVSSLNPVSIHDLAYLLADITEYEGQIHFNTTAPSGALRKELNDDYIRSLGWKELFSLRDGLENYVEKYLSEIVS
jgi:nucleoside-diphosphate-sugar epimerase